MAVRATVQTARIFEIELVDQPGESHPLLKVRRQLWNEMPSATPEERSMRAVIRWHAEGDVRGLVELQRSGEANAAAQKLTAEIMEAAMDKAIPRGGHVEARTREILSTYAMAKKAGYSEADTLQFLRERFYSKDRPRSIEDLLKDNKEWLALYVWMTDPQGKPPPPAPERRQRGRPKRAPN